MTQTQRLAKLLQRPKGCTSMDIIREVGTTSPSKRLSEMRDAGWLILKDKVDGTNYHRFKGVPPAKQIDQ